jgi:hypothetical protein
MTTITITRIGHVYEIRHLQSDRLISIELNYKAALRRAHAFNGILEADLR